jgi:hypothetical protein
MKNKSLKKRENKEGEKQNSLIIRVDRIVNKIIKNKNKDRIKKYIIDEKPKFKQTDTNQNFTKNLFYVSRLINNSPDFKPPEERERSYISNNLSEYISKNYKTDNITKIKIADIGGGNGQILREIGKNLEISKDNLFCIEQKTPWTEPYAFSNNEFIEYVFWDNKTIPTIEPLSLDIVFIMVTLHHMNDETINNTFENLIRLSKVGSFLIIKEHDCKTTEDKYVIDWEHHLYHLNETPLQTEEQIAKYKTEYIDNYKTKTTWDNTIEKYGYSIVGEFNRFFERTIDTKNSSNLYWKVYRNKGTDNKGTETQENPPKMMNERKIDVINTTNKKDRIRMVKSLIDTNVIYNEKKGMYDEDINHPSSLYEIYILNTPIAIVIGKMRTNTKGLQPIVYFPIYIIGEDKPDEPVIKSQIGVFEVLEKEYLSVIDEDGNLLLNKINEPIIYSFVNEKFLKKCNSQPKKYGEIISNHKDEPILKEEKEEKDKPAIFSLDVEETRETKIIKEKLKDGVFDIKPGFEPAPYLEEEIESTADKITKEYIPSKTDLWIQKLMENPFYDIKEVESNGDCLFAVVRDAYKEKGMITTVSKLRAIVANELTDDILSHHRELYETCFNEKKNLERELKNLKIEIENTKPLITAEKNRDKRKKLLDGTNLKINEYDKKLIEYEYSIKNLNEYKHIENIKNIDDYRNYIMTSNYWADAWSIFVLEQHLKMKMIIFSEEYYENGDEENVMNCGYSLDENNTFTPKFYIMTSYSGNHYRSISYKDKRILTFIEIPYHVKILIIKKCMEKNAGIYNSIQDFRDLKSKLHVGKESDKEGEGGYTEGMMGGSNYYDSNVVFTYHKKSVDSPIGKGINEKISNENVVEFAHLAKIKDWRRKLDDSWEQHNLLRLDNKNWKSVEHFVLGSQYKNKYPDVYLKFSLDTGSDISGDLSLAKKRIHPDYVIIDNEKVKAIKDDTKDLENREMAIKAKFTQNEDFKNLLILTKTAFLQKFIPGNLPEPNHYLMKLRKELQ